MVFDGDAAGSRATLQSFRNTVEVSGVQCFVVRLPDNQDPDSFLAAHGNPALGNLIDGAPELSDYVIGTLLTEDASTAGLEHALRSNLLPVVAEIKDPLRRSLIIQKIASASGIPVHDIEVSLNQEKQKTLRQNSLALKGSQTPPLTTEEEDTNAQVRKVQQAIRTELCSTGVTAEIFAQLVFGAQIKAEILTRLATDYLQYFELTPASMGFLRFILDLKLKAPHLRIADQSFEQLQEEHRVLPDFFTENFWSAFLKRAPLYLPENAGSSLLKLMQAWDTLRGKEELRKLKQQLLTASPEEKLELTSRIQDTLRRNIHPSTRDLGT
jgi:DNA primase